MKVAYHRPGELFLKRRKKALVRFATLLVTEENLGRCACHDRHRLVRRWDECRERGDKQQERRLEINTVSRKDDIWLWEVLG